MLRTVFGMIEHPARIERIKGIESTEGFERITYAIQQIVGFKRFSNRL